MAKQRRGGNKPDHSFRLRDCVARVPSVLPYFLPVWRINTVAQVRNVIERAALEELAESIRLQGQQTAAAVAAVSPEEIEGYLAVINELWSANHKVSDLKRSIIDDKPYYLIVIYGHRRLAALRLLENEQKQHRRRTPPVLYLTTIRFGLTITEVIRMQLAENMYVPPPKHREIDALVRMWRFESQAHRQLGKKLTLSAFARMMGRKPDAVRNALRFTTLPQALQDRIDPAGGYGVMSFGLLLQVARLVTALRRHGRTIDEMELVLLADSLVVREVTVKNFTREVDERIRQLEGGQVELFATDTFGVSQRQNRLVAGQGLIQAVLASIQYWHKVMHLQGQMAFDRPPLGTGTHAPQGPARMAVRLLSMLSSTLPHIKALFQEQERRRVKGLAALTETLPDMSSAFERIAALEVGEMFGGDEVGGMFGDIESGGLFKDQDGGEAEGGVIDDRNQGGLL